MAFCYIVFLRPPLHMHPPRPSRDRGAGGTLGRAQSAVAFRSLQFPGFFTLLSLRSEAKVGWQRQYDGTSFKNGQLNLLRSPATSNSNMTGNTMYVNTWRTKDWLIGRLYGRGGLYPDIERYLIGHFAPEPQERTHGNNAHAVTALIWKGNI